MIKKETKTTVNPISDIYKVNFKFHTEVKMKKAIKSCDNIITNDTETSNGYVDKDGIVHRLDKVRYDEEFKLDPTERAYQHFIDNECMPISCLYLWQVCVESFCPAPAVNESELFVFVGRTYKEFEDFIEMLVDEVRRQAYFGAGPARNRAQENERAKKAKQHVLMRVFIHNLGFEFQHYRNMWNDLFAKGKHNVFARDPRKPMKCKITFGGVSIEFRDTLSLTQKSLMKWSKDEDLFVKKLEEGEDFYEDIYTPLTPLEDERLQYSIQDVVSMAYGLEKYREKYGTLDETPLTQTGTVRKVCRSTTWQKDRTWCETCGAVQRSYNEYVYRILTKVYMGGWTHANAGYVGRVLHYISCYDFASSYPSVMTTRRFPISEFWNAGAQFFPQYKAMDIHTAPERWMAKIQFKGLKSCLHNSYWSNSKFADEPAKGAALDNGRIHACDDITIWIDDVDYDTFKQCYTWDEEICHELWAAEAGYLSKELILTILEYFSYKTSLKGTDNESLYNESKQFINSIYGVACTKLISKDVRFTSDTDRGWEVVDDMDMVKFYETMSKIKDKDSFITFAIGCWVTSWAKHNLFDLLIPMDKRVCYADTDSLKGLFNSKDEKLIEKWNKNLEKLQNKVAKDLGFDPAKYTAVTSKGKVKRLGIFEREDDYVDFKTLGAKRYVYKLEGDDEVHCTIAGLPKKSGAGKFKSVDEFTNNTFWNLEEAHKNAAIYNDNQPTYQKWTDINGKEYVADAKYGVCIKPTTFDLTVTDEFINFIGAVFFGDMNNREFFKDLPKILF